MSNSNICIFTATKQKDWGFPLTKTLMEYGLDGLTHTVLNNSQGLAKVYNDCLDLAIQKKFDYIMFIHDDVHLEHDPRPNLERAFEDFDIVGVAGCSRAEIKSPALWHLMGGGFNGGNLHGCVQHLKYMRYDFAPESGYYCKPPTNFGKFPHRVVMIDGVFMAFNRKAIETVRFDEDCPSGFHFYDLNLCARALEKGLKIGVGDVMITHESPGLREFTEDWKKGEEYYLETYGK